MAGNKNIVATRHSPPGPPNGSIGIHATTHLKTHLILFASIAAASVAFSAASASPTPIFATPQLAYGDDAALNTADVQDFGNRDVNRIRGNIAKVLARKAPYNDVLDGGTLENGVSDVVRAIVQERAVLNQSLVRPEFTNDTDICGKTGEAAQVGSTEYSYRLQTNRGMGPLVCVKGMRHAFEGSYTTAEDALKKQITMLSNSDVRATLVDRCGVKLVVKTGMTHAQMFDGDQQRIDQAFPTFVPDAPLNFKLLQYHGQFVRENFQVEGFEGTASEPLLKFIGSQEIIDRLRDEADVKQNHQYLAAGSYKLGEQQLTRYTWEGPYRGFAFGVDPQPLRFSVLNGSGQPLFIEPEIAVNTTKGVAARVNPAWVRARYEIALLVGANSFRRLTPAQYTGEGSWKFPAQVAMGELMWQVIKDNSSNVWGDYGRHFYQLSRAYRPERPHAVTAIAYKRAVADFGLVAVSDYSDYSSTDSL